MGADIVGEPGITPNLGVIVGGAICDSRTGLRTESSTGEQLAIRNADGYRGQEGADGVRCGFGQNGCVLSRSEQNGRRLLIVGFNPRDSNFPLESAFPLLMAGSVEWMTHSVDDVADSYSTGEIDFPGPASKITAPSGKEVPFARKDADIHFLALETGMYRIVSPGGETNITVNAPALPAQRVQPTAAEAAEVENEFRPPAASDMWRWLVLLAIVALWLEWLLYYSARERQRAAEVREAPADQPLAELDQELEEQEESGFRDPNLVGR